MTKTAPHDPGTHGQRSEAPASSRSRLAGWIVQPRGQLAFGWYSLLVFLTLGLGLEILHAFKVDLYLNAANDTRRLLWTLAHAHGTLLSLINIAFALSMRGSQGVPSRTQLLASRCLIGATILLPGGFFLGGIVIYAGDPGLLILLVPVGAVLLFVGVLCAARSAH